MTGDSDKRPGDKGDEADRLVIRPDANAPDYRVEPVPKVPRRIGWRWAVSDIIRIVFLGGLLALIIVARKPCSDSVARFVDTFDETDAGASTSDPRNWKLERLSEDQIRERFGPRDSGPTSADGDTAAEADAAPTAAP